MDPLWAHLLLCAVLLASAATQALTGFGFGLLALALLGLWMDLREAVLLTAPAGLVLNITLFLRLRRDFSLRGLVPLFLACAAGVPVGVWLLLNTGSRGLKLMVAILMIGTAVHRLWMQRGRPAGEWHPVKAGVPCGFLSGVLGGTFGVGGPPVVTYLVNRQVNRFCYVATVQVVAAIASSIRVTQFARKGAYAHVPPWMFLTSFVAVWCGVVLGVLLLKKISDESSRRVVLGFLFLGGFYYLFQV